MTEIEIRGRKPNTNEFVEAIFIYDANNVKDGKVKIGDKLYAPSPAAAKYCGYQPNGWKGFWEFEKDGKWVKIDALRKGGKTIQIQQEKHIPSKPGFIYVVEVGSATVFSFNFKEIKIGKTEKEKEKIPAYIRQRYATGSYAKPKIERLWKCNSQDIDEIENGIGKIAGMLSEAHRGETFLFLYENKYNDFLSIGDSMLKKIDVK